MRFEYRGRRVITRDHQHIRFKIQKIRYELVHLLDCPHLPMEISIFSEHIGFLDMNVEEIILIHIIPQCLHLISYAISGLQNIHTN